MTDPKPSKPGRAAPAVAAVAMSVLVGAVALLSVQSCTQNPEKTTVPKDTSVKNPPPEKPPEKPPEPVKEDYPPPAT